MPPLVILGCGFTGTATASLHLSTSPPSSRVIATTRSPDRAPSLSQLGIDPHVLRSLTPATVSPLLPDGALVLIAYPPDPLTDAAIAPLLSRARAIAYISSTAVYGDATGRVDEATPVDAANPRAAARLAAEALYLSQGAIVLRAAGIYGPHRGLHRRLLRGELRMAGDGDAHGRNVVSRIHVDDLARLALAALDRASPGEIFTVADDTPVPQIEVVRWLSERLRVPLPQPSPPEQVHETLRHDRAVDNVKIKRALGMALLYPSYREGFEACLAVEGAPFVAR